MKPNPGHLPREAAGKRVRVILAHGGEGSCDPNPMSPPGWPASTCHWGRRTMPDGSPYPFDIAEFEVIR